MLLPAFICSIEKNVIYSMRKLLLIISILLVGVALNAQSKRDSLLRVLRTAKEDTAKITLLLAVQKTYSANNFDSSFYYINTAKDLADKLKTDKFDYPINNKYSIYYYFKNDYDKAISYALKAKEVAEKQKDLVLLARTYNNIAGIHNHFNHPKIAIEYMLKCLDIAERAKDSSTFSSYNVTASETYGSLRQWDKAAIYAIKGIGYGKQFNEVGSVMNGMNNLSVCYSQLNKLDSAVWINEQQLALAKRENNIVHTNYALINLCYNNFRNGNTKAMKPYCDELRRNNNSLPGMRLAAEANVALALGFIGEEKYVQAAAQLDSGILTATAEENNISLENLYKTYSVLYYLQKKIKEAELYVYKTDSVVSKRNLEELNQYAEDLEKKYGTEKKEAQIQLQQTQLKQKNTLNYLLILGAAALLIILLLGYRNYKNRQRLQQLKIDELLAEKKLTATEAVLKGEEQERTRLAKDLHDGLGGMLSGVKYSLSNMKGNMIMTPDNLQAMERSIDMLDGSIKEMRRLAHNMMPEILVRYGLNVALQEFCSDIDQSGVIRADYQSVGMDKVVVEQTTAITLYRIVQELVNNAIKHAAAKNVLVQAHASEQEKLLTITVEDDGKGFDVDTLQRSPGIGWSNIQNRVEFLKGKIDVKSAPDKGVSVLIEVNVSGF